MTQLPSQLRHLLPPLLGLSAASLLVSFATVGGFFPHRLKDAALHGYVGSIVVAVCHLSALAAPALLMLMRPTWWSRLLLLPALSLLVFESTVYRVTDATAGYYDYLHLANAAGSLPSAVSEYGADAFRSALSIFGLLGAFTGLRWLGLRAGPRARPFFQAHFFRYPGLLILLLTMVAVSGFSLALYFRGHMATRGLTPGYGLPLSLALSAADDALRELPPAPKELQGGKSRARHILFVIDESVQFDVMRELWMQVPQSSSFGPPLPMLSYSNSSAASNSMLRHACDPRWPDRCLQGKGLLGKAKSAGYRVVFYDNQAVLKRGDNYFLPEEIECLDNCVFGDPEDPQPDITCLPGLIADLQPDHEPTFILMNKRGSHFKYADNFTPEQARPGEPAYHTSVRVNTVAFLQRLIDSGVLAHTALFFTSDHGQDWRKKVPHGSTDPAKARRAQWEVPAMVICPGSTRRSMEMPAEHWFSHFHLAEALNNELGCDDPEIPALNQALDAHYELNGDHQALYVFPFRTLGRRPNRMSLERTR